MKNTQTIMDLMNTQQTIMEKLQSEVNDIVTSEDALEKEELKKELSVLTNSFNTLTQEQEELTKEISSLKSELKQQMYNEKLHWINRSKSRMDELFEKDVDLKVNRLTVYERKTRGHIQQVSMQIDSLDTASKAEINAKIKELDELLQKRIDDFRRFQAEYNSGFKKAKDEELQSLYDSKITDKQMEKRTRSKNIESIIGLNILNKIGIFLLVIGTVAVGRFAYTKLTDLFKTIAIFVLGCGLVVAGELIKKKLSPVFCQGILSGGIAILYVGMVMGQIYGVIGLTASFVICIGITILAYILSIRNKSQTISVFALIGGYTPLFAVFYFNDTMSLTFNNFTVISVYLSILSIFALSISFLKRWDVTRIFATSLNIAAAIYFINIEVFDVQRAVVLLLFVGISAIMMISMPVITAIRNKLGFRKLDLAYIGATGIIYSVLIYFSSDILDKNGLIPAAALLCVFAFFILMTILIKKNLQTEKKAMGIFASMSFTLALIIPIMVLESENLIFAWMAESAVLLIFGILKNNKFSEITGWIAGSFTLGSFLIIDLFFEEHLYTSSDFLIRYGLLTAIIIAVLACTVYKNTATKNISKQIYKSIAIVWTWIFALVFISNIWQINSTNLTGTFYNNELIFFALMILAGLIVPFTALRIKGMFDMYTAITAATVYSVSFILINYQNIVFEYIKDTNPLIHAFSIILPCIANIAIIAGVLDATKTLLKQTDKNIDILPLPASAASIVLITEMMLYFGLKFSNPAISIVYIVFSILWILFGFKKHYTLIRHFGLGLTLISMAKLFFIDFSGANQIWRISSYFAFGILLIAISFIYQHFNKKAETIITKEN